MSDFYDYIVVGSGPSGAMAAQTIAEAGKKIAILDVGNKDEKYSNLVPNKDFNEIRKSEANQKRFFLGDDYEALPDDNVKTGAQLSPARKAMIKDVEKWLKIDSDNFFPMESLGYGGLGAGWGLGAYVYSDQELKKCGLPADEMKSAYQIVADRIGISCGDDDLKNYLVGDLENIQKPLKSDKSIAKILDKYQKKKKKLNKMEVFMGAPSMAFLSEDLNERKASEYKDMDFYADIGKSAYRAQFTIDDLKKLENFHYLDNSLVISFKELENYIEVKTIDVISKTEKIYKTGKLLLAAGAIGSGRIALRSLNINSLPILSNHYTYMPCIYPPMLGKSLGAKTSMAQAMMIYDKGLSHSNIVSVALYTYKSLLLHKLIKEGPVNYKDGRKLFQLLQSSFVIAGIHHPDEYSENKIMKLKKDQNSPTSDSLFVDFRRDNQEMKQIGKNEKHIQKALMKLGVYPIKKINPGNGSSIHYAGSLAFNKNGIIGNTNQNGKLYGFKNVYAVDGSGFKYLPAKGITLSLMANAHRVSKKLINN